MRGQVRLVVAVVVAVTMGAAGVAFGVALLLGDTVHLRSNATATLRTGDYLAATINVERVVVDAETGLRGYVITGEKLFLAPTIAAQAQLPQAARALERAASDEGAFVTRATALADSARAYMTSYVPRVTREVATDPKAARSVPTTALGAHAAAVTAMARWTLRSLAGSPRPPADVLRTLNEAMLRQDLDGRFITVAYALLSAHAGEARVTVACAGHPRRSPSPTTASPRDRRVDARGTLNLRSFEGGTTMKAPEHRAESDPRAGRAPRSDSDADRPLAAGVQQAIDQRAALARHPRAWDDQVEAGLLGLRPHVDLDV